MKLDFIQQVLLNCTALGVDPFLSENYRIEVTRDLTSDLSWLEKRPLSENRSLQELHFVLSSANQDGNGTG